MRISTWNVNSLKVRLQHLLDFLAEAKPDAVCLQETKTPDENFPSDVLKEAGYSAFFSGQKTYNGVAVLVRDETYAGSDPEAGIPGYPDPQKRLLAVTLTPKTGGDPVRLLSAYFPNGTAPGTVKYLYKLEWICALRNHLVSEMKRFPALLIAGDMNVAPEDRDCWDPEGWKGRILVSDAERGAFRSLLASGLEDTFRLVPQEPGVWSWWDYRNSAFLRNQGLRIDHMLATGPLARKVTNARVDSHWRSLAQPSDHAPVTLDLA